MQNHKAEHEQAEAGQAVDAISDIAPVFWPANPQHPIIGATEVVHEVFQANIALAPTFKAFNAPNNIECVTMQP